MWPFSHSAKQLTESGMLQGFTDWHSHILFGVDDGSRSLEESLDILKAYEDYGFKTIWLTPHIMEDYPNTPAALRQRFEELKAAYKGDIELHLAAENMLDNLFEERLAANDLLPIGDQGNHLLVETSYYNPPMGFYDIIDDIFSAGYFPILAHPERYTYMDESDYKRLKERGVKFQMNLISITGGFGKTAQKKAEWLLANDMIDFLGTDVHRIRRTAEYLSQSPRKAKYLEAVSRLAANPPEI